MNLRWLHLSDIHFNFQNYDTEHMRSRLIKYLKDLNLQCKFVVITGDFSYQNNGNKEYSIELYKFIESILSAVGVEKENLFIVPGNHDLNRNRARKVSINGIIKGDDPFNEMNEICNNPNDEVFKSLIKDHKQFSNFYHKLFNKQYPPSEGVNYLIKRPLFNIIHINTCLSCCEINEDNLVIGQNKLIKLLEDVENEEKLNIVIAHHGFDHFEDKQKEKLINLLSNYKIDLYLCGHVHKPQYGNIIDKVNEFPIFVSGSIIEDKYSKPSFIIGEFNFSNGEGKVEFHEWNEDLWRPMNSRKLKEDFRIAKFVNKNVKEELSATIDDNDSVISLKKK